MKKNIRKKGMNPALQALSEISRENKIINATAKVNMIVSIMVLHDKFGFGEKRATRFLDEYKKQLDAYNSGYVERVQDFEKVLWDECGIEVHL